MSELRKDPIVDRWVIMAKNRADRPSDLVPIERVRVQDGPCPFCEGNESQTPYEIVARRDPHAPADGPGWRVRVVPNKFPALVPDGDLAPVEQGLYLGQGAFGVHELIVESPRHEALTGQLSELELREVLEVYRERLLALKQDSNLRYAMIFKNVGAAAGASLEHIHSQLLATPMVPQVVAQEIDGSYRFYGEHGRCIFCDMLAQELAQRERVVERGDGFVAFCPYAARFPFETWIVPADHHSHYETLSPRGAVELARILKRTVMKIEAALEVPAYNFVIHTSPFDTQALGHYHWHIEIIPRVTEIAGYELGTGFYINPVPPEEAAAILRAIVVPYQVAQEISRTKTG
jgi:UDPglucose--hexose-1-phosphate uridylyltransferase